MSNNNSFSYEDQHTEDTETIGFYLRLDFKGDVYWATAGEATKHKTDALLIETEQDAIRLSKVLRRAFKKATPRFAKKNLSLPQVTVVPVSHADQIGDWFTRITA